MAREKKNDMRIRVLQERLDWLVENHQVKIQQKTFNFVNDCINRLRRNKGLTPGQRRWADSIIEEGLQKVECPAKNRKLYNRIESALKMEHASHNHNILGEFAVKLARGWDLSEKQLSHRLLHQHPVELDVLRDQATLDSLVLFQKDQLLIGLVLHSMEEEEALPLFYFPSLCNTLLT